MSKPKNHIPGFKDLLKQYADSRMLDFTKHTEYHIQITDGGYTMVNIWTTGRYYISTTDYLEMTDGNVVERSGEKGNIPIDTTYDFLDKIFFAGESLTIE